MGEGRRGAHDDRGGIACHLRALRAALCALRVRRTMLRPLPVSGEPPRNWRGPYLRRVVPNDPWGRAYLYAAPGRENPETYDLYSLGRDGRSGGEGEDADVTSWG